MKESLRILVSGMIASDPLQGGATWAVLQYLLGLRELGHEVWLVEPMAESSISPVGAAFQNSRNAAYFKQVVKHFGFRDASALLLSDADETVGAPYERIREFALDADLLINISGMLTDRALTEGIPCRAYLDLDPAFNQLWHVQGIDVHFAGHTHYVTIGQAIGNADCLVPTCGMNWIKTLQPVVLSSWTRAEATVPKSLATLGNWRGYGSITHDQIFFGQKAHSFRQFIDLPKRTHVRFEVALSIHPGEDRDLQALSDNGWTILDPVVVASTPDDYQRFVQTSWAEIGIAKSGYVKSKSGWFSDRSACYLASGRPVIAQETGFSKYLPTGVGLFAFETAEDVERAIASLTSDYTRHALAARQIAEEHFDARRVLPRLLEQLGVQS